ncbi:hypothetical protein DF185_08330 [Marinifilum breve]|uniref:Uncharacterized protein n=1 Tax=Marinifilum breve TaxID=2184082 RepID=A0A2V3ZYY0_9BACT|nr:hypothetical protein [Marinifilum breve]PXY01481.1 hypothetical protein DF185_08330 [Marinifilum breve]
MNLIRDIYLDHIPKFLLKNAPSNWLTESQIDSVINNQKLKESIKPITKRLEFDTKSKEYYWIVFNTLHEASSFTDEEILHINPISGVVFKHYEERLIQMHN